MSLRPAMWLFLTVLAAVLTGWAWWVTPQLFGPESSIFSRVPKGHIAVAAAPLAPAQVPKAPTASDMANAAATSSSPPAENPTGQATAAATTPADGAADTGTHGQKPSTEARALVIIEGDYSSGSGFIAKLHGQYFVVTNQHVLSGNTKFTVTGMDGTKYPTTGPLFGAVDYDIAILRIPTAQGALEVMDNPMDNAKIGNPVTVPGNEEGEGVVTHTVGHLLGIGPKLVEVDAKFVHGNSGSPIIQNDSGKVVGVASYVQVYQLDNLQKAAQKGKTRWFGYRLDTVKQWQELNWAKFSAEGVHLRQIENTTDAIVDVVTSDAPPKVDNEQVNDIVSLYINDAESAIKRNNKEDLLAAVQTLVEHLDTVGDTDLKNFAAQNLYDYHAREAKDQLQVRESLSKLLQNVGSLYYNSRPGGPSSSGPIRR